ncbi:cobalamin biosynthesis protein CobQ [Shimia ponticola]|uniref:cobalamin biosynthesis protein CobQ n=1 Tax=Shimia ponticola TaxID=2582893 RepID=UPI0011BFB28C|nr:cobalamin biosynthesis protein CobQ [Shimia ponticola]
MNTPAHLLLGAAAFGKVAQPRVTAAAVVGALLPDLSLYLMGAYAFFVLGLSPQVVFGELYFSDAWQQVFAIDNSFVLWGLALAVAIWTRTAWAIALCGSALLHIAFDFPLHADDARMHFWPLTDWKFHSPVSYWETSRGGAVIGAIEMLFVVVLAVILLIRHSHWTWRVGFGTLATLQVAPFFVWGLFF